jgi:hypothetical protein
MAKPRADRHSGGSQAQPMSVLSVAKLRLDFDDAARILSEAASVLQ